MQKDYFAIAVFVLALGLAGLVFSKVSNPPTGMAISNISLASPGEAGPAYSPEVVAKFNKQALICNKYLEAHDDNNSIDCLIEADSIKDDAQVILALAELYSVRGNYTESAKYYSRATVLEPADSIIRYNYAIVLERLNRTGDALEQYDAAIQLSANYIAPLNDKALLLQRLGRLNESKDSLEKAILIEENNSALILNYANILAELGQNTRAEENYRKALELSPDNKGAYRNFAQFLYNSGRYIEAKDMLEKSY